MDQFLHHLLCLFHCQIPQTGVAFLRALLLRLLQCLLLFLHTLHGCSLFCCGSSRLLLSFLFWSTPSLPLTLTPLLPFTPTPLLLLSLLSLLLLLLETPLSLLLQETPLLLFFFSSALCFSFLFFAAESACFARLAVVTAASLSFVSSCLSLALCLFVKVFFAVAIVNCSLLFALCSLQKNEFKVSKIGLCKDAISSMTMDVFTVSTSSLRGRG